MSNTITAEFTPATGIWMDSERTAGKVFSADVQIQGRFRHQRILTNYSILYAAPEAEFRRTFGGPVVAGEAAWLSALPTVIALHHPGVKPQVIEATVGDKVAIFGEEFVITDNIWGSDPILERI